MSGSTGVDDTTAVQKQTRDGSLNSTRYSARSTFRHARRRARTRAWHRHLDGATATPRDHHHHRRCLAEMIAINRVRVGSERITYTLADLFNWQPKDRTTASSSASGYRTYRWNDSMRFYRCLQLRCDAVESSSSWTGNANR